MTAASPSTRPRFFKDPLFCVLLAFAVGNLLLTWENPVWPRIGAGLEAVVAFTGNAEVTGMIAQAGVIVVAAFLLAFRARTLTARSGYRVAPPIAETTADPSARRWAALAHLSALSGIVTFFLGAIMGPTVVLASSRTRPFAYHHGREALAFNVFVFALIGVVMVVQVIWGDALTAGTTLGAWAGLIALGVILLGWMVFVVRAASAAHAGRRYRYPVSSGILHWWVP